MLAVGGLLLVWSLILFLGRRRGLAQARVRSDADHGKEHGEGGPQQEAEARIVQPQVYLDRLAKDRDDLSVEIVEQIGKSENGQREVSTAGRGGRAAVETSARGRGARLTT